MFSLPFRRLDGNRSPGINGRGLGFRPSTASRGFEAVGVENNMSIVQERRRLERFDLRLPANITVEGGGNGREGESLSLFTTDVCSDGAFFESSRPQPMGARVRVSFLVFSEMLRKRTGRCARVETRGSVVRGGQGGFAIQFSNSKKIRTQRLPENNFRSDQNIEEYQTVYFSV